MVSLRKSSRSAASTSASRGRGARGDGHSHSAPECSRALHLTTRATVERARPHTLYVDREPAPRCAVPARASTPRRRPVWVLIGGLLGLYLVHLRRQRARPRAPPARRVHLRRVVAARRRATHRRRRVALPTRRPLAADAHRLHPGRLRAGRRAAAPVRRQRLHARSDRSRCSAPLLAAAALAWSVRRLTGALALRCARGRAVPDAEPDRVPVGAAASRRHARAGHDAASAWPWPPPADSHAGGASSSCWRVLTKQTFLVAPVAVCLALWPLLAVRWLASARSSAGVLLVCVGDRPVADRRLVPVAHRARATRTKPNSTPSPS